MSWPRRLPELVVTFTRPLSQPRGESHESRFAVTHFDLRAFDIALGIAGRRQFDHDSLTAVVRDRISEPASWWNLVIRDEQRRQCQLFHLVLTPYFDHRGFRANVESRTALLLDVEGLSQLVININAHLLRGEAFSAAGARIQRALQAD